MITGYPFRNIYFYGTRLNIAGFFIDYQHFCNHPVQSTSIHCKYTKINGIKYYGQTESWYSNFYGETISTVSIGYEFEFDVYHN
jgi:hypothetical protein